MKSLSFWLILVVSAIFLAKCGLFGSKTPEPQPAGKPVVVDVRDENGALKTSVSFKLTNSLQEGANDIVVRSIFENANTETSFGQSIIETSSLSSEFSDVRPYNDPNSYYLIEMINYRVIKPKSINRMLYAKTFIFQFMLHFRNFKQAGSEQITTTSTNETAAPGYIITQVPITIKEIGNLSPLEIYALALDKFIYMTVTRNYYKPAMLIEQEYAGIPPKQ